MAQKLFKDNSETTFKNSSGYVAKTHSSGSAQWVSTLNTAHPLDPISKKEIKLTVDIIRKQMSDIVDKKTRFYRIMIQEPPKEDLLNYESANEDNKPDIPRITYTQLLAGRKTYEVVVNLQTATVQSQKHMLNVQPSLIAEDYEICEEIVKQDSRVQEALSKRGILDIDLVMVDGWCTGPWLNVTDTAEKRLLRPLLWVHREKDDNGYAYPLEGLDILVDLTEEKVAEFHDREIIPLPPMDPYSEYDDARVRQVSQKDWREEPKRLVITQPEGPSFQVDGNKVNWQGWEFRVGFNQREGLVLHQISIQDHDNNGEKRPIAWRFSVPEMVVPYGSPFNPSWRKCAFDAGEDGLGSNTNSLGLGCDCLGLIYYFDAYLVTGFGGVEKIENAICMHEEDTGYAWKHSDWRTSQSWSRRMRRLVLSFFTTIANYDYGFYWYFYQDGSIELEVKLTGIIATDIQFEHKKKFGTNVAPGLSSVIHAHFFNVRMDFCVDGQKMRFYEINSVPEVSKALNQRGNAFHATETLLKTENEAKRDLNPKTARLWKVASSTRKNRMGTPTAYKIMPSSNIQPMIADDSYLFQKAGFLRHQIWATEYFSNEINVSGDYPNQRAHDDGLAIWVAERNKKKGGHSLIDKNIVVWYNMAAHHIVRLEDWPVMPVEKIGFHIKPFGFFDRNPTVMLTPECKKHTKFPDPKL